MKKIFVLVVLLLLFTGCGSKQLENNYEKMEVGTEGINGYDLDLRVYGLVNEVSVNKIIRIKNYNNTEYEIAFVKPKLTIDRDNLNITEEDIYYLKNDKLYIKDETHEYVESSEAIKYRNPNIFIEGLKNIKKVTKETEETVGDLKYQIYEVIFKKDFIESMIETTDLTNVAVKGDLKGKIYIDSDGYLYRIIYEVDTLTINANYYNFDNAKSINIRAS